jgi:TatA/E family protein of Tat protein translocase
MFGIGMTELLVILVVALLVFGPQKLPELARSLGKAMNEFRRASSDLRASFQEAVDAPEAPTPRRPGAPPTIAAPTAPAPLDQPAVPPVPGPETTAAAAAQPTPSPAVPAPEPAEPAGATTPSSAANG